MYNERGKVRTGAHWEVSRWAESLIGSAVGCLRLTSDRARKGEARQFC